MIPQASDDESPSRAALEEPLTLNKRQSWFGSFRNAVHRGAVSAKAAVESLRGSPGDMYVHSPRRSTLLSPVTDKGIARRPLIQTSQTSRPLNAVHPTNSRVVMGHRLRNLPLRLCARTSAGIHVFPEEVAFHTSFAEVGAMHPACVVLVTQTPSSATRKILARVHHRWLGTGRPAKTLRWSHCHLHRSTYHHQCLP